MIWLLKWQKLPFSISRCAVMQLIHRDSSRQKSCLRWYAVGPIAELITVQGGAVHFEKSHTWLQRLTWHESTQNAQQGTWGTLLNSVGQKNMRKFLLFHPELIWPCSEDGLWITRFPLTSNLIAAIDGDLVIQWSKLLCYKCSCSSQQ
jgi:hypothetical protein